MNQISPDSRELLTRWYDANLFELDRWSTCVVAGAFTGRVMKLLQEMYSPARIVGFEPQLWAYERTVAQGFECYPYGLGTETASLPMGEWGTDACSFINVNSREKGTGQITEFSQAMEQVGIHEIDLFVINMEGYEYRLIPHLRDTGWLPKIQQIDIQFHIFPGVFYPREDIDALLSTHTPTYDNYPAWVLYTKAP